MLFGSYFGKCNYDRTGKENIETFDRIRKLYVRYVDGTLFLAKDDEIKYVFDKFNSFHKNLKFPKNHFVDNKVHFLNITIETADTD